MIKNNTQDVSKYVDYINKLGFSYNREPNRDLLLQTFVNKTYSADNNNIPHNQRLEFLGDAILGQIISYQLYKNFEKFEESDMTLRKIGLVREETLSKVAKKIGLDKMILLGNGEEKKGGRDNSSILCDSTEAVIGYLYIDLGYEIAKEFIIKYIYSELDNLDLMDTKSYKGLLQELIQSKYKKLPTYIEEEIERDDKINYIKYKANVLINDKIIGSGYGTSKKKAQEDAAKSAYESLIS